MILATARAVSDDDFIHRKVLMKVIGEIAEEGDLGTNPADFYLKCWEVACRALGVKDPYENEKARGNKTALGILKYLSEHYPTKPEDALASAIRVSFAGTMLDYTALGRSEVQDEIAIQFRTPPARNESEALIAALGKAESVMIVAGRAGEMAMDKPLAEVLTGMGRKVYLAVAAKPVFSMATEKDAVTSGYSKGIEVVNPGTAMYGLAPELASTEFQELFERVDVIVAKGSTNFITITPQREIFFILKASEEAVAEKLGIPTGGGAVAKVDAPT